jgi:predicted ABC-type sugar transport system permease subunit
VTRGIRVYNCAIITVPARDLASRVLAYCLVAVSMASSSQQIVIGAVIILAVLIDQLRRRG